MPAFSSPFPLVAARRAHLPFTARAPTSIETARAFVRFVAAVVVVVAAIVVLFFSFSPPFFFSPTLSFFPQRHALEMNPSRYVPSHFHDRQKFISNRNVNISVLQLDSRKYPVFIKSVFSCFDNFREREREREKWV